MSLKYEPVSEPLHISVKYLCDGKELLSGALSREEGSTKHHLRANT